MTDTKRAAIATFLGILTGALCITGLLLFPPAGLRPESGAVAMIFYGRLLQGFVIGMGKDRQDRQGSCHRTSFMDRIGKIIADRRLNNNPSRGCRGRGGQTTICYGCIQNWL